MLRHKHKDFILKMRKEERHFMPQVLKDLAKRIGRRGSYLLFLAMLDFLYGYSLIVVASQSRFQNPVNLILPQQAWGVIWITVGIFCLWQAFVRLDLLGIARLTLREHPPVAGAKPEIATLFILAKTSARLEVSA